MTDQDGTLKGEEASPLGVGFNGRAEPDYLSKAPNRLLESPSYLDASALADPDSPLISQSPDWEIWKHLRFADARHAAALALGINPVVMDTCGAIGWDRVIDPDPEGRYRLLLDIMDNRFREFTDGGDHWCDEVDLIRFGEFVESLGEEFALPPGYPRAKLKTVRHGTMDESKSTPAETLSADEQSENLDMPAEDIPPYVTDRMRVLFEVMRAIQASPERKPKAIIMEKTGLESRDAAILAALVNNKPDGRAEWRPR